MRICFTTRCECFICARIEQIITTVDFVNVLPWPYSSQSSSNCCKVAVGNHFEKLATISRPLVAMSGNRF